MRARPFLRPPGSLLLHESGHHAAACGAGRHDGIDIGFFDAADGVDRDRAGGADFLYKGKASPTEAFFAFCFKDGAQDDEVCPQGKGLLHVLHAVGGGADTGKAFRA